VVEHKGDSSFAAPLLLPQEKEMEDEAKSKIELPNPSLRSGQATATIVE